MKLSYPQGMVYALWSPPARGAWIETTLALIEIAAQLGRPPRGGRGLKRIALGDNPLERVVSPPARGAWIETSIPPMLCS